MTDVAELINRARYPITEPESSALAAQVATLRASLRKAAPRKRRRFSARGLERCIADAESLASRQYKALERNRISEEPDPKWAADHPRAIRQRYGVGVVTPRSVPRRVAGAALV
jgi:hypothetical protein